MTTQDLLDRAQSIIDEIRSDAITPARLGELVRDMITIASKGDSDIQDLFASMIYNVSQATDNYAHTPTTARGAVPTKRRKKGSILSYKTPTGDVLEMFTGSDLSLWTNENSWTAFGTKADVKRLEEKSAEIERDANNSNRGLNYILCKSGVHADKLNKIIKELYVEKKDGYVTDNNLVIELFRKNISPNKIEISFYERTNTGATADNGYYKLEFDISNYSHGYISNAVSYKIGVVGDNYSIIALIDPNGAVDGELTWTNIGISENVFFLENSPILKSKNIDKKLSVTSDKANNSAKITVTKTPITLPYTGTLDKKGFLSGTSNITPSDIYDLYDYIPVESNSVISITGTAMRMAWYDKDKKPLNGQAESNIGSTEKFVLIPENCKFICLYRRYIPTNLIYTYEINKITLTTVERVSNAGVDLSSMISIGSLKKILSAYNNAIIHSDIINIPELYTGVNNDKGLSPTGAIQPAVGFWDLTDYIPCSYKKIRIVQSSTFASVGAAYDSNKNPLGRLSMTSANQEVILPDKTAYIVFYKNRKTDGVITETYNYLIAHEVRYLRSMDESFSLDLANIGVSQADLDKIKKYTDDSIAPLSTRVVSVEILSNEAKISADGAQGALQANQNKFEQLEDQILAIAPNAVEPYYLPRPSNGIVNFQVPVNCANADTDSETLANQEVVNIHYDWGILTIPSNYKQVGAPIRLVIACHGTGTWYNGSSTSTTHSSILNAMGYAVLDVNGIPASFAGSTNGVDIPSKRHYGAPFALESYIKGYRYVIDRYNIAKDGCFIYGISMGGLSSFMVAQSGSIPIIAQGAFCPCIDLYKQAFVNPWNGATQREQICEYFGFNKGVKPTFTSNRPPTQAEIDYFAANKDKWIGYNNMAKGLIGNIDELNALIPSSSVIEDNAEEALYSNVSKRHIPPLKIWHCKDDSTVRWRYSKYYVRMVSNNGGLARLRTFPSGGHNAWSQGETVTNIPTISGGTISMQASIYELIQWFKRFDR